jgi:hypothetical protein
MADRPIEPLDLLVFAPVGAALELRSRLPELAEAGRRHVNLQVLTARSIGQFTVSQARQQLPGLLEEARSRGLDPLGLLGGSVTGDAEATDDDEPLAEVVDLPRPSDPPSEAPAVADLPIHDYDSLSAVQVVPRLDALDEAGLAEIARYEAANRGRRTILHRVAQLRGEVS